MTNQPACIKCKYSYDAICTRTRKIIRKELNPFKGEYYDVYNINAFDLPFITEERKNRGIIKSFIFGKTCGETAQFFEKK